MRHLTEKTDLSEGFFFNEELGGRGAGKVFKLPDKMHLIIIAAIVRHLCQGIVVGM